MDDVKFGKFLIVVNAFVPLVLIGYDAMTGGLGANPVEFFLRTTGVVTFVFLIISLCVTPIRKITGWNMAIKYRRMIGLFAFFYACLHLITYSIFDKGLSLPDIGADIIQRPFILVGMIAFVILLLLAVTSTNGMIKRMGGKNWARLHRWVYAAGILAAIHFWMIVKSDIFYPAIFAAAVALLLSYRIFNAAKPKLKPASRA